MVQTKLAQKKKFGLKMPHLFFLMLGLILIMSLLTYVIPAGEFAKDPQTGRLLGGQFALLGHQTPVSPWAALNMILPGFMNSSYVISLLLIGGGTVGIIMDTGAIDEMINWAIYKLKDKGVTVLVPMLFCIIALQGAFGGGDQMIAIVPIGVMFAHKLRLDPIVAVAVSFFASFVGFAVGPTRVLTAQLMMGIEPYSGFGMRFVVMILTVVVAALFTLRYALRVSKDPAKSVMGNTDWLSSCDAVEVGVVKEVKLNLRAAAVTVLFFAQYFIIVYMMTVLKSPNTIMPAVQILVSVLCGLAYGKSFDEIGVSFAKGTAGMAFVGAIIGLAGTMSLVMTSGNILHTIVYYACLPLQRLSLGFAAIGMSAVVTVINLFIPSASAKMAILIPIIQPMSETLGMSGNLAVTAFQIGDGFTNLITPALGVTAGSLAICGVPLSKWLKWAVPIVVLMVLINWVILYFLGLSGWTGV